MTDKQMSTAAAAFAERWQGEGYEKGQSQMFWSDLLTKVYGIEDLTSFVRFEEQVKSDTSTTNFIDVRIPSTKVFIEQKSINKDLRAPIKQSDGNFLTPFQQVKRYDDGKKYSERPRWIVTCNFKEFLVYDMEQPNSEPESILLKDLEKEYHRMKFLVDVKSEHIKKEMEVSMQAGEIVGRIYDALLKQYDFTHQRRCSFEYICFNGLNDTPLYAREIVRLLEGLEIEKKVFSPPKEFF